MSFYEYIVNNDTNSITWFKKTFDIELLPRRVCSSRVISSILKNNTNEYNYIKNTIFKECFLEYFKHHFDNLDLYQNNDNKNNDNEIILR